MNTHNISALALLSMLALAGNAQAASLTLKPSSNMTVMDGVIQIGQGGTVNLDLQLVLDDGDALARTLRWRDPGELRREQV